MAVSTLSNAPSEIGIEARLAVGFERIVVPLDFSDVSDRALEYAKSLARVSDAMLVLAHVGEPISPVTPPEVIWFEQFTAPPKEEQRLQTEAAQLHSEGFHARAASLVGQVQQEILALTERVHGDLIVMGTHGRTGLSRFFLGSEAEALFRHSHCPILVVGPNAVAVVGESWRPREILCACDMDPDSAATVAYAHRLAQLFGGNVTIVHVDDSRGEASGEMQTLRFEFALEPLLSGDLRPSYLRRELMIGYNVGSTIADIALERRADLIVIGAHGANPAQTHMPRGIAPQAIAKAKCPVLVLHQ